MRELNGLVVDGDESFRHEVSELLKSAGFSVQEALSGNEGLEKAKKERFTVVCCAYQLTDISGSDFCGQIRGLPAYYFSSVLVLTNDDNSKSIKSVLFSGATDVFSKKELVDLGVYLQRFSEREQRQLGGRVLVAEDSNVLQEIIFDLVTDMGLDVDAYTSGEEAWEAFQESHYDLVITDIMLEGGMTGVSLVRRIRRLQGTNDEVPIIATSGFDNLSRKIELFHLGVNDYISKPIIREELRQRVFNHITSYKNLLELREQQKALNSLSIFDPLTQLFSRHALREFSAKYFSDAKRFKHSLSLVMINIDYFRDLNEDNGHKTGDKILAELGPWLRRSIREGDLAVRWSGDEFLFLLTNCAEDTAVILMKRLQRQLILLRPAEHDITLSIGIATMGGDDVEGDLNSLLELADGAMYQAKMAGRNCIQVYENKS